MCGVTALMILLVFSTGPVRAGAGLDNDPDNAQARRAEYASRINEKDNDHFSDTSHFLPSLMTSDTGAFLDPKTFPTAQYCGHCRQESHQQWRESAHSNSNRAPWYLRNVNLLTVSKGVEYTRHCEGCHDPVALAAGVLTQGLEARRPFDAEGVTCMVCHSIQKGDTRGTGSCVLGAPAVLVDAGGQPILRPVSDAEILTHPDRHSPAVMRPFYKTSEFCASWHKAALPQQLNDYKWQRAISLSDQWQGSSFAKESPLPFYVKDMASVTRVLLVGDNEPATPLTGQNPAWMRWNDYGIALLDAQQSDRSRAAFARVAALRPGYADAYSNEAIAEFSWQHFADARTHLERALRLAPDSARARYYLALVERNDGNLPGAVKQMREAAQFADQKDDPSADPQALKYLTGHLEVANESVA